MRPRKYLGQAWDVVTAYLVQWGRGLAAAEISPPRARAARAL